jgi:hypothetical protein
MKMNYLSSQKKLHKQLQQLVNNDVRSLFVEGNLDSGKKYAVHGYLSDQKNYSVINFSSEIDFDEREYYPFFCGIENIYKLDINKVITHSLDDISQNESAKIKFPLYLVKKIVSKNHKIGVFNEREIEILAKLENILKKSSNNIFICSDIQNWDTTSLDFLLVLLDGRSQQFECLTNTKFIVTYSPCDNIKKTEKIKTIQKKCERKYKMSKLEFSDYQTLFDNMTYEFKLEKDLGELIGAVTNDNISYIKMIVSELIEQPKYENGTIPSLEDILQKRLSEFGASGNQIKEVLEYASIIGYTFSAIELEKVTQLNRDEFITIIKQANNLKLIAEKNNEYYNFALQIIRKMFEVQAKTKGVKYYTDLAAIIKEIRPAEYLRRAWYLKEINSKEADDLFVLGLLKQMREFKMINVNKRKEIEPLISIEHARYLDLMEKAYNSYYEEEYEAARHVLKQTRFMDSKKLQAEVTILLSHCLSKSLDETDRTYAIEIFEAYNNISSVDNEKDLFERILFRKLTSYTHGGKKEQGLEIEHELYKMLKEREEYDEQAKHNLNNLRRISNTLHDSNHSRYFTEQAVSYFEPNNQEEVPLYLIDYYKSLCNYSGTLIMCGEFEEGFVVAKKAKKLEIEFKEVDFPRQQIVMNNYLLSGYLSDQLSIKDCIIGYRSIIDNMNIIAERVYFTSNLSIFYALNNQVDDAKMILENEVIAQQLKADLEGLYNYRIVANTAVYDFLLGNHKVGIEKLESLRNYLSTVEDPLMNRKNEKLIEKMKNSKETLTGEEWLHIIHPRKDFNKTERDYYYLGYVFTTLYNWDL